ncbi:unnamed protein product [Schistocephalus solidus]|uniref:Secreted protein n=1 Tax=Schistocephalus solidus TaxID=70667 RepID=A0A183T3U2_SCHSO|nr:unnamed protein product [Schistocephalus solidus]
MPMARIQARAGRHALTHCALRWWQRQLTSAAATVGAATAITTFHARTSMIYTARRDSTPLTDGRPLSLALFDLVPPLQLPRPDRPPVGRRSDAPTRHANANDISFVGTAKEHGPLRVRLQKIRTAHQHEKTVVMHQSPPNTTYNAARINVNDTQLHSVDTFTYLGSILSCSGKINDELRRPIQSTKIRRGSLTTSNSAASAE